jgi:hypothetical protein
MAGGSELAEFVTRFGSSSWCKESSKGDERRGFCFFHQRRGKRRISRRSGGCGRFLQLVSKADLRLNWGKSIERVTRISKLTQAIQRYARLGSEAAESVVSERTCTAVA